LSPKVAPLSVEALKITSPFVFGVPWSVHHTIYTFSPDMTLGAFGFYVVGSMSGLIHEYAN
jgi:hypothetical protein